MKKLLSFFDENNLWLGNQEVEMRVGVSKPNTTEIQFMPSKENTIGVYQPDTDSWLEVTDNRQIPFYTEQGVEQRVEAFDDEFPKEAIFEQPPKISADELIRFEDEQWQVYPNHRGKTYYDEFNNEQTVTDDIFKLAENQSWEAKPEAEEGFDFVLENSKWVKKASYVGKTLYFTVDQSELTVEEIGELPEGYTLIQPDSKYHTWNGKKWMLTEENKAKQLADKQAELVANVDQVASEITVNWLRFNEEYKERELAAIAYKNTKHKDKPSIYIASFSKAAGISAEKACDLILAKAESLRTAQANLSAQRMRKHELKADGLSLEQMQSIHDEIITAMQAIAAEHQ